MSSIAASGIAQTWCEGDLGGFFDPGVLGFDHGGSHPGFAGGGGGEPARAGGTGLRCGTCGIVGCGAGLGRTICGTNAGSAAGPGPPGSGAMPGCT